MVIVIMVIVVMVMVMVMVIVVVVVVVAGFESHALGDESEKEDLGEHIAGWEDSVGMISPKINTALYTPQQVNHLH